MSIRKTSRITRVRPHSRSHRLDVTRVIGGSPCCCCFCSTSQSFRVSSPLQNLGNAILRVFVVSGMNVFQTVCNVGVDVVIVDRFVLVVLWTYKRVDRSRFFCLSHTCHNSTSLTYGQMHQSLELINPGTLKQQMQRVQTHSMGAD